MWKVVRRPVKWGDTVRWISKDNHPACIGVVAICTDHYPNVFQVRLPPEAKLKDKTMGSNWGGNNQGVWWEIVEKEEEENEFGPVCP